MNSSEVADYNSMYKTTGAHPEHGSMTSSVNNPYSTWVSPAAKKAAAQTAKNQRRRSSFLGRLFYDPQPLGFDSLMCPKATGGGGKMDDRLGLSHTKSAPQLEANSSMDSDVAEVSSQVHAQTMRHTSDYGNTLGATSDIGTYGGGGSTMNSNRSSGISLNDQHPSLAKSNTTPTNLGTDSNNNPDVYDSVNAYTIHNPYWSQDTELSQSMTRTSSSSDQSGSSKHKGAYAHVSQAQEELKSKVRRNSLVNAEGIPFPEAAPAESKLQRRRSSVMSALGLNKHGLAR